MERSAWPKNLSSSRKHVIQDLLHGQNPVKKLADLFDAHSQTSNNTGKPLFTEDLVKNVLGSFSNTQSLSSSTWSDEVLRIPTNAYVRSEVSEGSESVKSPLPRKTSNTQKRLDQACTKSVEGLSDLCISLKGSHRCRYTDCTKGAQGSTLFCKAHGGGKRCTFAGCTKGARGLSGFCISHAGGRRCRYIGCQRVAQGSTLFCDAHGGGKHCTFAGCTKGAKGSTPFCEGHGGGKRCSFLGCAWGQPGSGFGGEGSGPCNSFARGKTGLCALHSGRNLRDDNRRQWRTYHQESIIDFELPGENSNLWLTARVSRDLDDEYQWRMIVNQGNIPEFPGNYFRCAYQTDQECPAAKLVRKMLDNPPVYAIAYRGRHTCNEFHSEPTIILNSSILPIFNTSLIAKQDDNNNLFSSSTFSAMDHKQRLSSKDDLNSDSHGDDDNSNNNNQSASSDYYTALESAGEIEALSTDQG